MKQDYLEKANNLVNAVKTNLLKPMYDGLKNNTDQNHGETQQQLTELLTAVVKTQTQLADSVNAIQKRLDRLEKLLEEINASQNAWADGIASITWEESNKEDG